MATRRRVRVTHRRTVKLKPKLVCTGCGYSASPTSFRSATSSTGARCPRCRRTLV